MIYLKTFSEFVNENLNESSKIYRLWVLLPGAKKFRKLTIATRSIEALKKDAAAYAEDLIQNLPDRGKFPMNLQPQSLAIATDDGELVWVDYPYTEAQLKRNPSLKNSIDSALTRSGLKFVNENLQEDMSILSEDTQKLANDIMKAAIKADIKATQILPTQKGKTFEIEFGTNVNLKSTEDLAANLKDMGHSVTMKGTKMIVE